MIRYYDDLFLSDDLFLVSPEFNNSKKYDHVPKATAPCNCLPECCSLFYLLEASESSLERRDPMALSSVKFL